MKKTFALLMVLLMMLSVQAGATEATPTEIHTPQDLAAIAADPAGSYILMEDLDMAGEGWPAVDFSGSFDGNGHAILNLTLTAFGVQKPESYDGNRKAYETAYVGLFSTMQNAQVKNLKLLNVRAVIESDEPCFLGGIAGYAENSTITDCTVSGVLELRAHDRMFGVGGLVGYGSGSIERCNADVTLICTDTDEATRDEQFLGGIYATGFMDVKDCVVAIDGYVSEHGYAHNGGVTGMYMEYPFGQGKKGYVTGNTVTGKITFFENNTNRRAYCEAVIGEALVSRYILDNNKQEFKRDERWEYDKELRPEMCENPTYTQTVTPAGCDTYGYISNQCDSCGYTYKDQYMVFNHTVTKWEVTKAPTTELEGLSTGHCDGCGIEMTRVEPVLEPEPTTIPPTTQLLPTEPVKTEPEKANNGKLLLGLVLLVLLTAAAVTIVLLNLRGRSKGGKYLKK